MAGSYDGSIKIDTKLDSGNFSSGMAKVVTSAKAAFGKLVSTIAQGVMQMANIGTILTLIGVIIATVATKVYKFFEQLTNNLAKSLSHTSAYYSQVMSLKGAFDSVKGSMQALFTTLLTAATPALLWVINLLQRIITFIQMVFAALTGQATVMQYVSGSAEGIANGTGKAAKNTKKMGEAAKGALAAFDELNVLQMNQEDNTGGGAGTGGNIMLKEIPVDSKILKTVDDIKKWFQNAWDYVVNLWGTLSTWFKTNVWDPLVAQWNYAWSTNWLFIQGVWNWIVTAWGTISTWFKANVLDPIVSAWTNAWAINSIIAYDAWMTVKYVWGVVSSWFQTNVLAPMVAGWTTNWGILKSIANTVFGGFKTNWTIFLGVFNTIIDAMVAGWTTNWEIMKTVVGTVWNGIVIFIKGAINLIIDLINGLLSGATSGINSLINDLNTFGGKVPGWKTIPNVSAPQIPRLATGAVIPPNAEFAAILGDQRNGRNLELPENLLRQIIRDEGSSNDMTITMPVYLDGEKIYENQKKVQRRRGTSLIVGGTA